MVDGKKQDFWPKINIGTQKTCSCRQGFLSTGRNDKSTLFFDGSNLKFEDSRG